MASLRNLQAGKEFDDVKSRMFSKISKHERVADITGYIIESIEEINNQTLLEKFHKKQKEIKLRVSSNEKLLFHGTSKSASDIIISNGFSTDKARADGLLGPGIYFADRSSKSNIYAACQCTRDRSCQKCSRYMLLCNVELGHTYKAVSFYDSDKFKFYDSVEVEKSSHTIAVNSVTAYEEPGFIKYPEYAIYDVNQAYPKYRIKYKIRI